MTNRLKPGKAQERAKPRLPGENLPSEKPGVTADQQGQFNNELLNAANLGENTKIRRLLALGANINVSDAAGWTALHYAAWRSHAKTCALLLANGADATARGGPFNKGRMPMQVALLEKSALTTRILGAAAVMPLVGSGRSKAFAAAFEECISPFSL